MKRITFIMMSLVALSAQCQGKREVYPLAKELIKPKNDQRSETSAISKIHPIGRFKNQIALAGEDSTEIIYFLLYDETNNTVKPDIVSVDQKKHKIVRARRHNDLIFLMGYFDLEQQFENNSVKSIPLDSHEYQDLWIQTKNHQYKIDSLPYHFIDKYYECKFSTDGRYIICNPFTSMTSGYDAEEDGFILFYYLKDIEKGIVDRKVVPCESCLHTFLIDDTVFFQKEIPIGNGFDGDFHNIYKAPLTNINDTTLLAKDIELEIISPDKNYLLGAKYLYGKRIPVVVNLRTGMFQYILGRDYPIDKSFYSTSEEKFAFYFDKYTVYIEIPDAFPFSVFVNHSRYTSKQENEKFWLGHSYSSVK